MASKGRETYLIVGGGGFLGRAIVEMLLERGDVDVRVFDIRQSFEDPRVKFFVGDIRKADDLRPALAGVTAVFNTVSPPHGNKYEIYYGVNVDGTKQLLVTSAECGVKKYIHTSSSSVVFDGNDLKGADETTPYAKKHIDPYSYTKELAEREVLAANGKGGMLTVALRPSGIFGPRDAQYWPTLIDVAKSGKWKVQIGDGTNLQDFTYVDNVAHAHLLAAEKLKPGSAVAGEVFIITNDEPYPMWDMNAYVYQGMGYGKPYIKLPKLLMIYFALLMDWIVWILSPVVKLHPNFTWFRIVTGTAHRYFKIDKAKKVLGYKPPISLQEGMKRSLAWFQEQEALKNKNNSGNKPAVGAAAKKPRTAKA